MADSYSLKAILSAVDGISPVLKNVSNVARGARKYLGDVGSSLNGLTSKLGIPLGIVSAIGAGFGALAIKKAVVDFAELGETVQKGAMKAGTSTDDYQRLKYVFDQAGVSADVMEGSMGKLNKRLGDAASGKGKDLESLLKTLHIPLRGLNGQVRTGVDLLPQLADAFVKNKNPVAQAAIGNALFGKSFAEMLPLLNEGSAGINRSLERISKLKGLISQDDLKGAKEFGDQLKDLSIVTKGFQMTIAKELVPVLAPVIESFIMWAAANKKLVAGEVKQMVQGLVRTLKQIDWAAFIKGVQGAFATIGTLVDKVGGLGNALIILAVIMNLQTIAAAAGLIASLGRLALALFGVGGAATAATVQMAFFAASQGSISGILTGGLLGAAKSAGLLAAAAAVGYAIGTLIYKGIEDWDITKALGEKIAQVLAFFGNADAQASLASSAKLAAMNAGQLPAAGPAAAPGTLGSGSYNLNAPTAQKIDGRIMVDFANAPPGMRVTQVQAAGPLAMKTNVGQRSIGEGSW